MEASETTEAKRPWEQLTPLIDGGERRAARAFIAELDPVETVRVVSQLRDEHRVRLLEMLRPEAAADVLEHIPDAVAGDALEHIEPRRAARILEELPSAEQADLLGEIDEEEAEAILAHFEPEEARHLRELAAYDEESAGGLMFRELARVPSGSSVARVVHYLRAQADVLPASGEHVYVVDGQGRLVGALRLRDLLLAAGSARVDALMTADPLRVSVDAPLEELQRFFDQEHVFAVPVVGPDQLLVGLLRRSAVEEALAQQSEEDYRASQGIVGGEELRSMPLALRSRRRLSWLSVNVFLNVLAASVIAMYQETLEAAIALAVFLPIISDMSGCSGNQAVAVSMRELTLGVVRPADWWRVVLAEARVGLVNGAALGLLIGAVAWLWKGDVWLASVVGTSLALNTVVAVCLGGGIPLALKRLGRDPALASGPILTTVTDSCGFLVVLTLASLVLGKLAG